MAEMEASDVFTQQINTLVERILPEKKTMGMVSRSRQRGESQNQPRRVEGVPPLYAYDETRKPPPLLCFILRTM